jgi:RNA polymerase sigma-70 factor, ECF subfamily
LGLLKEQAVALLYTQHGSTANLKPLWQRCVWQSVNTEDANGGVQLEAQELHWLDQARRGDQAAFSRLVEAYQRPVYNLAYRMLGNAAEAEEAAQETFVRMFTKLHTYQSDRKLVSWVLSIASHYCIDRLRRRRINWLSLDDEPIASVLPSHQLSPEETALRREASDALQDCIAQLEPGYRAPLILRYWQGLSYEEIAEVLGISVSAVKSRLHRARLQIAGRAQAHPAFAETTLALR